MAKDFNHPRVVEHYDQHIRQLIPGYELVHQQIQAILLTYLKSEAHILIVGCGTGYELEYLLSQSLTWQFTVTELSENMLNQARTRVLGLGQLHRVNFVLGSHESMNMWGQFDAVLSILVTHFVIRPEKQLFLSKIYELLNSEGIFISFDLMQFTSLLEQQVLPELCQHLGLTPRQTENMMQRLEHDFALISQQEYRQILEKIGFQQIHCFSQILSYVAYWAVK